METRTPRPARGRHWSTRATSWLLEPLRHFFRTEAAGGVLLFVAAATAIAVMSSSQGPTFERFWSIPVRGVVSPRFIVNDALMTLFFLVVGLEIRRELKVGVLSDARRAMLPVAGALGGMVIPALLYLLHNRSADTRPGWGTPMATDIAFAIGVLALIGNSVPREVRVLLLALAIIDDVGAVLVIAIYYSAGLHLPGLALATLGLLGFLLLRRSGVSRRLPYFLPAAGLWLGLLRGGVHPTLAGVLMGMLMPPGKSSGSSSERSLESTLHPWIAFGVMPLFALANAGIDLRTPVLRLPSAGPVIAGIICGLVVGKPLGILLACRLAVWLRLAAAPQQVGWRGLALIGLLGGVGFTMAIFIATLAFPTDGHLEAAKRAILLSSTISALLAFVVGRRVYRRQGERAPDAPTRPRALARQADARA